MKKRSKPKKRLVVLSLGGSIIVPNKIDVDFLKKFRKLIISRIKLKKEKFIIVCGGGRLARDYINAAKKLGCRNDIEEDRIGIKATNLNSELLMVMFGKHAHKEVALDYRKNVKFNGVLICSGLVPGTSSDYDSIMFALTNRAKSVINLSNIRYVYSKDPRKFKNARRIEDMTWNEYHKIIGGRFKAGMNVPFDQLAAKKAKQKRMNVAIMDGRDLKNLGRFLDGKKFRGTIIHS